MRLWATAMYSFLKNIKASGTSSFSPKLEIHRSVPRTDPPREHFPLRASDLMNDKYEFCPREHAFLDLQVASKKGEFIGTAQRLTFNHGRFMEDQIRNDLLRHLAVGDWVCGVCGHQLNTFSEAPKIKCPSCGWGHKWQYNEVRYEDPYTGVSGGLDLLLKCGAPQHLMVELKTISPDMFKELVAPLAEHKARTALYLRLVAQSTIPHSDRVNSKEARVLYAMKAYGVKDESLKANGIKDSAFSPFKEFRVTRNDDILATPLARARVLKVWRETKKGMPCGVCPNGLMKRAQSCSAVSACFSGKYPSTLTWTENGHVKHPGKNVIE